MTATVDFRDEGLEFPPDFIFGAATAAYQIEGATAGDGRGPSIWDTFAHTPGRTLNGDTGDTACDHYHRLDEDLDLMHRLGLESYRFSISWSRVLPSGRGRVNPAGIAFYERLVDGLIARGIRPIATLYHWDLPQALEDEGGWASRDTAYAFADYARIMGEALGDRITLWSTLNEPWCSAFLGYAAGVHAPGRTDGAAALAAMHHLNLAHGLALIELRKVVTNDPEFSISLPLQVIRASGPTGAEAMRRIDGLANRVWLEPLLEGAYPADVIADTRDITDWAFVRPGDLSIINQPLDVLGLNYYRTISVRMWDGTGQRQIADGGNDGPSAWPGSEDVEFLLQPGPHTEMDWNIEPAGLEELLISLHERYPWIGLMIHENGGAFVDETVDDDPTVHDFDRVDYLRRHLTAVHRARDRGADVRGYQVWSLLDNFEWALGYDKRFGIVRVAFDTLERTPKDSAHWYSALIAGRRIPSLRWSRN